MNSDIGGAGRGLEKGIDARAHREQEEPVGAGIGWMAAVYFSGKTRWPAAKKLSLASSLRPPGFNWRRDPKEASVLHALDKATWALELSGHECPRLRSTTALGC